MRSSYETVSCGLDQLFFSGFIQDERPEDRAETIETFLKLNGWTWDQLLDEMEKQNGYY